MHFVCVIIVPKKIFESGRNLVKKYIDLVMECNIEICDWYVIGGRWDRLFKEDYKQNISEKFNFGEEFQKISNNSIQISNLLQMYKDKKIKRNLNIIDPNMIYYDASYFNINHSLELLEKFIDSYAINVDCHI